MNLKLEQKILGTKDNYSRDFTLRFYVIKEIHTITALKNRTEYECDVLLINGHLEKYEKISEKELIKKIERANQVICLSRPHQLFVND